MPGDCPFRSDHELIQSCLQGDQESWRNLVDRYARLVYSIPHRNGLAPGEANQVFQRVFLMLSERMASLRHRRELGPWLVQLAYRETMRHIQAPEQDPSPQDVQVWLRQHYVHLALTQLDEPCRALLKARVATEPQAALPSQSAPHRTDDPLSLAECFKRLEVILDDLGIDLSP
jgi:DNA-directed RNA polymerase specialized sigma24 family protein